MTQVNLKKLVCVVCVLERETEGEDNHISLYALSPVVYLFVMDASLSVPCTQQLNSTRREGGGGYEV